MATATFAANTWWVDDDNYGAAVQDGSETNPFGTIIDAITNTACVAGDTIKVRPGIYDKGYYETTVTISSTDYQVRYRVLFNKKLNIIATGTKEETHIVGHLSSVAEGGNDTYHSGPTAIKCVRVTSDGENSTLTGFTIRDSASIDVSSDMTYIDGGAIGVQSYSKKFYVTDCVISNCFSRKYGGATCGGTFNRCRIFGCAASNRGSAFYNSYAINTVVAGCQLLDASYTTLSYHSGDRLVNCTFYGNKAGQVNTLNCYNCLFAGNLSNEKTNKTVVASNVYASPGRDYCNEPNEFPLFAPYLGDFHPITGSVAIGVGDPSKFSLITLPSGTEIRDLDGNLIDTTAEHITAGAFQTAKTRPETEHKYGAVFIDGLVSINGHPCTFNPLVYADTWPTTIKVSPIGNNFRLSVTGEKLTGVHTVNSRFTGMDGSIAITLPYAQGAVQTNTVTNVSFTRYVDANNGDDGNDGKSPDAAFKTLQRAVDAIGEASSSNQTKGWRIYVAEGDYNEGGAAYSARGVTNRINVTGVARFIKFIATGDRDKTIIRGAAAKNERNPENYPGCGPDAIRCVSYYYNSSSSVATLAFVGFTFADGHTDCEQSTSEYNIGGAAFGRVNNGMTDGLQFIDCVFTNCYAQEGIASRARFTRCRFIDCGAGTRGFRYAVLDSCIVEKGNFAKGVFGTYAVALNCSVADANAIQPADGQGRALLNCALGESGLMDTSSATWGSTTYSCFVDAANGDFRFVSGAPALDATRRAFPSPGDADWGDFTKYFSSYASCNIDGSLFVVSGGFPVAGAYVGWVPGVSLALDAGNYSITGAATGGNPFAPGATVTIARSPSAVRHYGIVANGVTNMLDSGTYTYTMPTESSMTSGAIDQVLDPNWYVNPDPLSGASDLNDGFTTNTPKLTLAGVLSVATNAGDIVNAYPGTYDSGEMHHAEDAPVAARGVIAENVTLQAVGGVAETIIKGAPSTAPDKDSNGHGTNAVRCLYVREGGCARGFKLTGGRTDRRYESGDTRAACNGGGAYLYGGALVDCELTGNASAYRGPAVTGGKSGSAIIRCYVHDHAISGSYSVHSYVTVVDSYLVATGPYYGNGPVLNSTFTGDVRSSGTLRILNTYLKSASTPPNSPGCPAYCTNCVFTATAEGAVTAYATYDTNTCRFAAATADNLDDDRRPKTAASPLVDFGDKALYDAWFPAKWVRFKTNRDRTGGQRIYNGQIDVGCGEYDFRNDFAALLGPRAVIPEMGPNVTTNAARNVVVPEGDSIDLSVPGRSSGRARRYQLVYTPEGGSQTVISEKSTAPFSRTLDGACTVQSLDVRNGFIVDFK